MGKTQEFTHRCVVGKPRGWVADGGDPGWRQHGDRPWFKNGSFGPSQMKYNYLLCIVEF